MSEYYQRRHLPAFPSIGTGHEALAQGFFAYYGSVFQAGVLSKREKSLAALAVAHVVQCPYCIDAYTTGALEAGADLEQLTEAIHVAAAVRAGSTLMFGMQAVTQAEHLALTGTTAPKDGYFDRKHVVDLAQEHLPTPSLFASARTWMQMALAEGALEASTKSVIAVASAHGIQCPYAIDSATQVAKGENISLEALTEAAHIAAAIRGGASLVHGIQMLEQVQETSGEEQT